MSKLPKPSLSITYHQSFNKSNLLVKNIGFRRNLTFCCISVQIFNSLNRLKLIFVGFTRKSEKSGQYYWSSSRISSKSVKITQTPWYFSNGQKVSKLRGPVKITRTQDYANPTVLWQEWVIVLCVLMTSHNRIFTDFNLGFYETHVHQMNSTQLKGV